MRGARGSTLLALLVAFASVHVAYFLLGVRYDSSPLTAFWQDLDVEWLKEDLARSLVYLHCQPPLWNLLLGLVLKLAPEHHDVVFQGLALGVGFALYSSSFELLKLMGTPPRLAFLGASLFMASPAFVLNEHCLFYPFLVTASLALSAVFLGWFLRSGRALAAWGFFAALAVVTLTWSLFHLGYLLVITAALAFLAGTRRRRVLAAAAPAVAVLVLLYGKNLVLFGHFAPTTWLGMNMARITVRRVEPEERKTLVRTGALSSVSLVRPFAPLREYPASLRTSRFEVPCLSRETKSTGEPNMNHFAYVAISEIYLRDALTVIGREPRAYLLGVGEAWLHYLSSATDSSVLLKNASAIPRTVALEDALYGRWGQGVFEREGASCHLYIFLTAAIVAALAHGLGVALGHAPAERRILALYLCFNILWVALLGNSLEVGENNRFRFATDPLSLALLGGLLARFRSGAASVAADTP